MKGRHVVRSQVKLLVKCLGREHAKHPGFWAVAHLYSCTAGTFFWLQCRPTALCSDERARSSGISRGSTQGSTRGALYPCAPTLSTVPSLIDDHLEGYPALGYTCSWQVSCPALHMRLKDVPLSPAAPVGGQRLRLLHQPTCDAPSSGRWQHRDVAHIRNAW